MLLKRSLWLSIILTAVYMTLGILVQVCIEFPSDLLTYLFIPVALAFWNGSVKSSGTPATEEVLRSLTITGTGVCLVFFLLGLIIFKLRQGYRS